jgi:hypothetical protein
MFGNALILALAMTLAADPPAPASSRNGERICRGGGQRTLGSHVRTARRCLTAEQWRQEDEARTRTGPAPGLQVTAGQNDGRNASLQPR